VRISKPVPTHRDLHDGQMLIVGRDVALLDFDLLCMSDSALDAANLAVHLQLRALQRVGEATAESALGCAAALIEGLDREGEPGFISRLRFYQASTFLRLSGVYAVRPRYESLAPTLCALAARSLDELERDA
jgi:hypothetical protein